MKKTFRQGLSHRSGTADQITASASVPGDSAWYDGHFPGHPLLPGIAILALVEEAILAAEIEEGRTMRITGVGRVRFRLPVRPDEELALKISRQEGRGGWTYLFTVSLAGEPACTGAFTAKPADTPQNKFLDKGC
jgi:3-hydroxyacyl-[acyl-carrier-protein] dehydratase